MFNKRWKENTKLEKARLERNAVFAFENNGSVNAKIHN